MLLLSESFENFDLISVGDFLNSVDAVSISPEVSGCLRCHFLDCFVEATATGQGGPYQKRSFPP